MKTIKFGLKPIFVFIIWLTSALTCISSLNAASLNAHLDEIFNLQQAKKYEVALNKLSKLKASKELADLKLFIEADCLKGLKQNEKALKKYETIIKKFPNGEMAYQSRFLAFMLNYGICRDNFASNPNLSASKIKNAVSKLEAMASKLPTAWQRGTAFSKLSELSLLKPGRKSRFAMSSFNAFYEGSVFFKRNSAAHSLIDAIISNPQGWAFNDAEWVKIYLKAASEGILKEKHCGALYTALKSYHAAAPLFKAEALRIAKKNKQALALYNDVIESSRAQGQPSALAYYLRANALFALNRYAEASQDYKIALQFSGVFIDRLECLYNLMRSAYKTGCDTEAINLITELCREPKLKSILPVHLYEMGLECFDKQSYSRSAIYFMQLIKHFQDHHRADDALAYAAMALGTKTAEGKALLELLVQKYPNSFYIVWLLPQKANEPLAFAKEKKEKLKPRLKERIAVIKKLWATKYAVHAQNEAVRLTDENPGNMALYKEITQTAREQNDYHKLVSFGERLARVFLEQGKTLSAMPKWGWQAMYPKAYYTTVKANAAKFGIDAMWVLAIMREESHFKKDTLSHSNAMGLMQILPNTGKWISQKLSEKHFKKNKLWNVDLNIRYGSWYLSFLYGMFNKNLYLASAAYNGGQGNILRKVVNGPHASKPVLESLDKVPLPETRDYYKKVMGSYWVYKRLYK